jgi:hypothetical protein
MSIADYFTTWFNTPGTPTLRVERDRRNTNQLIISQVGAYRRDGEARQYGVSGGVWPVFFKMSQLGTGVIYSAFVDEIMQTVGKSASGVYKFTLTAHATFCAHRRQANISKCGCT